MAERINEMHDRHPDQVRIPLKTLTYVCPNFRQNTEKTLYPFCKFTVQVEGIEFQDGPSGELEILPTDSVLTHMEGRPDCPAVRFVQRQLTAKNPDREPIEGVLEFQSNCKIGKTQ